jgi:hypothetical protein
MFGQISHRVGLLVRRAVFRLISAPRPSLKYLSNLGWCFSANVIAAPFKLSDRRTFQLCQVFGHFVVLDNLILNHHRGRA